MANAQFIKNLLRLRQKKGLTQQSLAGMLNISRQAYSNYEKGKREPDMNMLIRIALVLGVTLDDLLLQPIPVHRNNIIREEKEPYVATLKNELNQIHYVSSHDLDMFMKYQTLPREDKRIVDIILNGLSSVDG